MKHRWPFCYFYVLTCSARYENFFRETGVAHRITFSFSYFLIYLFIYLFTLGTKGVLLYSLTFWRRNFFFFNFGTPYI